MNDTEQGIQTVGRFFGRLMRDTSDLSPIADAMEHYEAELVHLHASLKITNMQMRKVVRELNGWHAYRMAQLDEINSIIKFLDERIAAEMQVHRKKFIENYAKALTATTAEKYAEAEKSVVDLVAIRLEVEHLAGRFSPAVKSMDNMRYSLKILSDLSMKHMDDLLI